jgi:hypothetical protein
MASLVLHDRHAPILSIMHRRRNDVVVLVEDDGVTGPTWTRTPSSRLQHVGLMSCPCGSRDDHEGIERTVERPKPALNE